MQTNPNTTSPTGTRPTDINRGLEYERARAKLEVIAGQRWTEFRKTIEGVDLDAMDKARKAYQAARNAKENLHPRDTAEIAAILGGVL